MDSAPVQTDISDIGLDSAPPPSAGDEGLSADALIDKYAEPSEEAPAGPQASEPAASAKPAAETQQQAAQQPQEAETAEPYLKEPETEDVKKAFKSLQKWHPEVAKDLRNAYYERKAYRENFTVPEVRQLRQMFPSVQDANEARAAVADLVAVDELLHSAPERLLNFIQQKDPQAFMNLAMSVPQVLYRMDPAAYKQNVSEPAVRNYHDFWANHAQKTGDQDLQTAIEIIRDREQRVLGTSNQPAAQVQQDPRMLAELNQLRSERATQQQAIVGQFQDAIDNSFDQAARAEVNNIIARTGAVMSDEARQEIVERTIGDVKDQILRDPVLQRRLNFAVNNGPRNQNQHAELHHLLLAHARRFTPQYAANHISWMTDKILQLNAGQLKKAASVMPARTISGATPGSAGKLKLSKDQVDKMSEDDIIRAAADGSL